MENPLHNIYCMVRNEIMARSGLQPRSPYVYSLNNKSFRDDGKLRIPLPNLAGGYHPVLRQFWDAHSLGSSSLLVSESKPVKVEMSRRYPGTAFTTSDLFTELMTSSASEGPDHIWDVCLPAPKDLRKVHFESIICHALLEHVIDPTAALRNMTELLHEGGHMYLMTHTPSYHKHSYPRDYVRFHHDYFEDLPGFLAKGYHVGIKLIEMYSHKGIVCVCYRKTILEKTTDA